MKNDLVTTQSSKHLYLIILFLMLGRFSYAQTDTLTAQKHPFFDLSLEELMNVQLSTTSKFNENLREAPGIVSIISTEDIKAGNCRDMVDVFNMIPGFTILTDLLELQSLGTRGLYGFEGRALIMVDGMQMNDNFFGTYPLGNDFPLSVIDRIEIVRGPGSVIYGGAAELAVINIITKKATEKLHVDIAGNYGITTDHAIQTGHRDITLGISQQLEELSYSLFSSFGESAKATSSDRLDFLSVDPNFPVYDVNINTTGNRNFIVGGNLSIGERIELTTIYKNYKNFMPIVDDITGNQWGGFWTRGETFESFNTNLTSNHKLLGFSISPGISTQYNLSWYMNSPEHRTIRETGINIWRLKPYLMVENSFTSLLSSKDKLTFILGGEYSIDFASQVFKTDTDGSEIKVLKKPVDEEWSTEVNIWNYSIYTSLKYHIWDFNFITGLRFDYNELTTSKFSPRIGITFVKPKFHSKLLYSEAYRAPNLANIATDYSIANYPMYNQNVKRETTKIYELELGYRFTKQIFATINIYSQVIEDIIEFNPDFDFLSTNATRADGSTARHGSEGFETEIKYRTKKYNGLINTSFSIPGNEYLLAQKENIDGKTYVSPYTDATYYNGIPRFKLYTSHCYYFSDKISVSASLVHYSTRYEYRYTDDFEAYARKIPGQYIVNFGFHLQHIGISNMEFDLSVHDLFNQQLKYVSAFDTYWLYDSTPFSSVNARGREFSIKLTYTFEKE